MSTAQTLRRSHLVSLGAQRKEDIQVARLGCEHTIQGLQEAAVQLYQRTGLFMDRKECADA
jgi:hypothetical protein